MISPSAYRKAAFIVIFIVIIVGGIGIALTH